MMRFTKEQEALANSVEAAIQAVTGLSAETLIEMRIRILQKHPPPNFRPGLLALMEGFQKLARARGNDLIFDREDILSGKGEVAVVLGGSVIYPVKTNGRA